MSPTSCPTPRLPGARDDASTSATGPSVSIRVEDGLPLSAVASRGQGTFPILPAGMVPRENRATGDHPAPSGGSAVAGRCPSRDDSRPELPHETPAVEDRKSSGETHETEPGQRQAQALATLCEEFIRLTTQEGYGVVQAAGLLNKRPSFFSGRNSVLARYRRGGIAALAPALRDGAAQRGDLAREIESLRWFIPAAKFFYLLSNRTWSKGSVPEAVRRTIALPELPSGWKTDMRARFVTRMEALGFSGTIPECPAPLRDAILARQKAGQSIVPDRIARQIEVNDATVEHFRNPTNAALRLMNAAGCAKFRRDDNGNSVPLRAGDRMMPDDGSINFCVCVPWGFPTDLCARKFGVMVGRFQLLLFVDALTQSIRARSFVARPRSSYRQEDALHLYHIFMRQHGIPREVWHEGHVWNSGRVKDCLDLLRVRRQLTHSPHTKAAVEGRFNKLWTVLSVLSGGQIGRFRGEMEKENQILTSCKQGHTDPRQHFVMLSDAIRLIDQAIAEANATPVQTDVGTFIPDELWAEHLAQTPLRAMEPSNEWMFWPYCEERKVRNGVTISVPLFEDFSVPFTFAASWMPLYHGASVRCYFDPWSENRSQGMVVLNEDWGTDKAGKLLGPAAQTNDIGEFARQLLGFGFGPDDLGRKIKQAQAAAMRSDRRAIIPNGRGARVVEERDGTGTVLKVDRDTTAPAPAASNPKPETRNLFTPLPPQSRPAAEDPAMADFIDD